MNRNTKDFKKFAELTALKEISLACKQEYEMLTRRRDDRGGVILQDPPKKAVQFTVPSIIHEYLKMVAPITKTRAGEYLTKLVLDDMEFNIELFKEEEKEMRLG